MPSYNMGSPRVTPDANPQQGQCVINDPFSGPSGTTAVIAGYNGGTNPKFNGWTFNAAQTRVVDATNLSTGGMSTGIGYGLNYVFNPTAPQSIKDEGFTDDYTPGLSYNDPTQASLQTITNTQPAVGARQTPFGACLLAIGGGYSQKTVNGFCKNQPFQAQQILAYGGNTANTGSQRDSGIVVGAGFGIKTVTATAGIAYGAAVETGFLNRASRFNTGTQANQTFALTTGQSVFGSNATNNPALALCTVA